MSTTSKRCLVFYDTENKDDSLSFAFETDSDKIAFAKHFVKMIEDMNYLSEDWNLFSSKYNYVQHGVYATKSILHLYPKTYPPPKTYMFSKDTDKELLVLANFVEKMIESHKEHVEFVNDNIYMYFDVLQFPFQEDEVRSFILDKTGEPGIASKIVDMTKD